MTFANFIYAAPKNFIFLHIMKKNGTQEVFSKKETPGGQLPDI